MSALGAHVNWRTAGKVGAGEGFGHSDNIFRRTGGDQISAVAASARAKVNHVIGAANGFLVMLHHQNGVAQVAQFLQRFQQASIVAMMQADGRFIEHVQHTA